MVNSSIEYQIKRKKFFESKKVPDRSFKTLTAKRKPIRISRKKLLPDLTLYPKEWTYLVSNEKHPHTITIDEFRKKELKPGDKVYFERGQIYNFGEYDITVDNITIGSFGSGVDPKFLGDEDISTLSWTDEGGGIYSASMAEEPDWVWIDGECAKLAETARITVASRGSLTTATISHSAVSSYSSIVGSYLVIKEKNFQNSQKVTVTNYNGAGVITFDGNIPDTNNVDLVLYNNTEYFSGNNEWAWESGTLYIKAAASPSSMNIRVSSFNYGFKSSGSLTVENIEFAEYYQFGIWTDTQDALTVDNCSFHDFRDNAILLQRGTTGSTISNSSFVNIGNNGITTRPAVDLTITNNTFEGIGMQANYNWQTWADGDGSIVPAGVLKGGCGIAYMVDLDDDSYDGENTIIEYNKFNNLAYAAINLGLGTENRIRFNEISGFMSRYVDGGGIYLFHYRPQNVPNENNIIAYNYIHHDNGGSATPEQKLGICGIYMDNRTRGSNIHHNTIFKISGIGIRLSADTREHTIEDNNILDCGLYGVAFRNYNISPISMLYSRNEGNFFNRNAIGAVRLAEECMLFEDNTSDATWNPYTDGGGANNNYYIRPVGDPNRIADSDNKGSNLTLSDLKTAYGQDLASVLVYQIPRLQINWTGATSNEDALNDYLDLSLSPLSTYTIPAYYSRMILERYYSNQFTAASSQYFNAGTTSDIQFAHNSNFSISFWFKFASNPAANQIIISNQDASTSRGYGIAVTSAGTFQVNIVNTVSTNRATITTAVDVADNAWHHFMFCSPGDVANSKIFIDGADAGTVIANNLSATIASTANLQIGRLNAGTNYLSGFIDELAIWNVSKISNIAGIYGNGKIHDLREDHPPLHYWRMGEAGSLIDGTVDVGTSASLLNLTNVNGVTASTDVP